MLMNWRVILYELHLEEIIMSKLCKMDHSEETVFGLSKTLSGFVTVWA